MRIVTLFAILGVLSVVPGIRLAAAGTDGFGFYPSSVNVAEGLRGQRYDAGTVIINQTDEPRLFKLSARGDIAPWISFAHRQDPSTPITEITVDPESEGGLAILIDIPATAANGEYLGSVLLENYPLEGQSFSVISGMEQSITINVTGTQKLDVRLGESLAKDVEVGSPLRIETQLTNAGNVDIVPTVGVVIEAVRGSRQPVEVARFNTDGRPVLSDKTATVETIWETIGQAVGSYRASLSVGVQGHNFGTREITFNIVPVGALTRAGRVVEMKLVGEPEVGQLARVDISFENQGKVDALARFAGQVYRDGAAVAESNSQGEILVRTGITADIVTFLPISAEGDYVLRGRVFFEGAQTEEGVLEFRVGNPEAGAQRTLVISGVVALGSVAALAVGGTAAYRRKRNSRRAR